MGAGGGALISLASQRDPQGPSPVMLIQREPHGECQRDGENDTLTRKKGGGGSGLAKNEVSGERNRRRAVSRGIAVKKGTGAAVTPRD